MCYIYLAMVKSSVELGSMPSAARTRARSTVPSTLPSTVRSARRRDVGAASARSLLLTVLGEFVLPAGEPVWTLTLVEGLGLLAVEEKAIRQALARAAREGWITPSRSGRRTSWRLTPAGRELLSTGAQRIYGFQTPAPTWAGTWLLVLASAPAGSRQHRHLLRTRLAWSGLGSLAPGVWVSAHPGRQPEVRRVLQDLGMAEGATFFVASLGELGDPRRIASQAWDLAAVELRYERFIRQVQDLRPGTPRETFAAQVRIVQEWRRFPLLDPGLPAELLPRPWRGAGAADLFRRKHAQWKPAADTAWQALTRS